MQSKVWNVQNKYKLLPNDYLDEKLLVICSDSLHIFKSFILSL